MAQKLNYRQVASADPAKPSGDFEVFKYRSPTEAGVKVGTTVPLYRVKVADYGVTIDIEGLLLEAVRRANRTRSGKATIVGGLVKVVTVAANTEGEPREFGELYQELEP